MPQPSKTLQTRLDSVRTALLAGRLDEARRTVSRLMISEPPTLEIFLYGGAICLRQFDYPGALGYYEKAFRLQFGTSTKKPNNPACSRARLQHDIEQLNYLQAGNLLEPARAGTVSAYEALLDHALRHPETNGLFGLSEQLLKQVPDYNKAIHIYVPKEVHGPILNPELDFDRIEEEYFARQNECTFIDHLLMPDVLQELRRQCLESRFWFDTYKNGYVGVNLERGFSSKLVFRIASDLQEKFPRMIGRLPLTAAWALKYQQRLPGTGCHADSARTNINFWITPDEANLDPGGGGLVVYNLEPPREWRYQEYNGPEQQLQEFANQHPNTAVRVPYKCNRGVFFNSKYIHKTDAFDFRPGYANRRINVTFLFGDPLDPGAG